MRLTGGVLGAVTIAAACLTASAAEATRQAEFLPGRIVPGKSIGPLRLGMSEQAARQALRRLDRGSRLVKRIRRGTPSEYVEYSYPILYTAYEVGYLGPPAKRRVVLIITHVDENKTREGVGVSTTETRLLRTYRGLRCKQVLVGNPARKECLLGSRNGPHTIFALGPEHVISGRPPLPPRIMGVVVRSPFMRSRPDYGNH